MLVYRTLLLSISILVGLSPSLLAEKPKITPADRISSGPAVVTSLEAKPSRSWPTTERWTDSSQTLHHQFYIKQRWLGESHQLHRRVMLTEQICLLHSTFSWTTDAV